LELARMEMLATEPGDEHGARLVHSLIGQIVNREDRGRAMQRSAPFDRVDVYGQERRLPVVRMHDVGKEADRLTQLERCTAEEGEALQVVGVCVTRRAVEMRA